MIHREGLQTLLIVFTFASAAGILAALKPNLWTTILLLTFFIMELLMLWFFRNPNRDIEEMLNGITSPCDGKVVVIEEVFEPEYFNQKRLQVSIFMSPLNVHVNRNCMSGDVVYSKYHPGKYLVAWHPKSSTKNERHTIVYKNGENEILVRQIAGFLARRIINYLNIGQKTMQGSEMGFIKFGSRVDLFLPLDANVKVKLGDVVEANYDLIATLP